MISVCVVSVESLSNQSLRAALLLTSVDKHSLSVSSLSGMKDCSVGQIQECVRVCVSGFGGWIGKYPYSLKRSVTMMFGTTEND